MSKKIRGFFAPERSWEDEWQDMPEYENKSIKPYQTIAVHFRDKQDIKDFSELLKQILTTKTKSIWYPKRIPRILLNKWYIDES